MIQCALPREAGGRGCASAYICTEGRPPLRRLRQMADTRWRAMTPAQRQATALAWGQSYEPALADSSRKRPRATTASHPKAASPSAGAPHLDHDASSMKADASILWSPHLILQATNPAEATAAIRRLRVAARARRIGLVVLDSVAALLRGDASAGPGWRRA